MKKFKKVVSLLLAVVVLFASLPAAFAQGLSYKEVTEKANAALSQVTSVAVKGEATISMDQNGQALAIAQADVEANLDLTNAQGDAQLDLNSALVGGTQKFEAALKDGKFYTRSESGGAEAVYNESDASAQQENYKKAIAETLAQLANTNVDAETAAAAEKYFDVTQTNDEYVVALKQGIDGKQFYEDNKATIDAMKEQSIKNAGADSKADVEKFYTSETFEKFFAANPKFEMHYDNESFLLEKLVLDVTVDGADFVGDATSAASAGKFNVKAEVNFSSYNEPVNVDVPTKD